MIKILVALKIPTLVLLCTLFAASSHGKGVSADAKTITASLAGEPPTLDSSLTEDSESNFILSQIKEGLVRTDSRGKIAPGVAERWETHAQGATFYLNPNAKWSDGKPVTAYDFEFAWKRTVTPATGASGSTFMYFVLDNAAEIIAGEKPVTTLGVRAINATPLEVTTSHYVPYIVEALSSISFLPQRQDIVERFGDTYAAEAKHQVFNGPFMLEEWVHGAKLSLTKNPHYWNQSDITLRGIDFGYITSDKRALFNLYQSEELATLKIDNTIVQEVADAGVRLRKRPSHCYRQLTLNLRPERPTGNLSLRKAMLNAFDVETYVNRVIAMPGTIKLTSLYGDSIMNLKGQKFNEAFISPFSKITKDQVESDLAQAKRELGELPTLVLLSREGNEKQDEYVQALLKRELNLDVQIDRQSFKQAIEKLIGGDFDIAFSGFCNGTLTDPYITATAYKSTNPFNDGKFSSQLYDQLLEQTKSVTNPAERMKIFARLEQLLFEAAAIIPTHQESDLYIHDNRLRKISYGPSKDFSRGLIRN